MRILLTPEELSELDRQRPATKANGGWQQLLVGLQEKVNRTTRELVLNGSDLA